MPPLATAGVSVAVDCGSCLLTCRDDSVAIMIELSLFLEARPCLLIETPGFYSCSLTGEREGPKGESESERVGSEI